MDSWKSNNTCYYYIETAKNRLLKTVFLDYNFLYTKISKILSISLFFSFIYLSNTLNE